MSLAFRYGLVAGGIGLMLGYVGPILLTQSNQGPLLGIFITGPIGFLIGFVIGAIRERVKR